MMEREELIKGIGYLAVCLIMSWVGYMSKDFHYGWLISSLYGVYALGTGWRALKHLYNYRKLL